MLGGAPSGLVASLFPISFAASPASYSPLMRRKTLPALVVACLRRYKNLLKL